MKTVLLLALNKRLTIPFHLLFSEKYSLINYGSQIPSFLLHKTGKSSLSNISLSDKDSGMIIQNFNLNKAHVHDMAISRMS